MLRLKFIGNESYIIAKVYQTFGIKVPDKDGLIVEILDNNVYLFYRYCNIIGDELH